MNGTRNGTGAQVWEPHPMGLFLTPTPVSAWTTGYGGSGTQVQIWSCSGNDNKSRTLP
jgi:hypothetical protein